MAIIKKRVLIEKIKYQNYTS